MSDVARLLAGLTRLGERLRAPPKAATAGSGSVTANQRRILAELDEDDPVMVTELADVLGVTASTMSLNLKRLVDEGLVVRQRDPADRRVMNVRLTAAGSGARGHGDGFDRARAAAVLGRLRSDQRQRVVDAVLLLADSADAVSALDATYLRGLVEDATDSE